MKTVKYDIEIAFLKEGANDVSKTCMHAIQGRFLVSFAQKIDFF